MQYDKKDTFSPENTGRKEKPNKLEKIAIGAAIVAIATAVGYGLYRLYKYIIRKREESYRR